jgi:Leucine-rich repeat (LRR) protein
MNKMKKIILMSALLFTLQFSANCMQIETENQNDQMEPAVNVIDEQKNDFIEQLNNNGIYVNKCAAMNGRLKLENLPGTCLNISGILTLVNSQTWLTSLELSNCDSLIFMPDNLNKCINLRSLRIIGCSNLIELPYGLCTLTNLTIIEIMFCHNIQTVPQLLGNLINLQQLLIRGCKSFSSLPNSIGNLKNLEILQIIACSEFVSLPDSVAELTNLLELEINSDKFRFIQEGIGNLLKLQTLSIIGSNELRSVPKNIGKLVSLKHLNLTGCSNLKLLPEELSNLINLEILELMTCGVNSLPNGIFDIDSLRKLDVMCCNMIITYQQYSKLIKKNNLEITGCLYLALPYPAI